MTRNLTLVIIAVACLVQVTLSAKDGYRLWLQFDELENASLRTAYAAELQKIIVDGDDQVLATAGNELAQGLSSMLGTPIQIPGTENVQNAIVLGIIGQSDLVDGMVKPSEVAQLNAEGYLLRKGISNGKPCMLLTAKSGRGVLYGAFQLLRKIQRQENIQSLNILNNPALQHRVLNHWDNLDRTVERGYAGFSIWDWHQLPEYLDPRYKDYARANASIGINGSVVTNVNANALVFRGDYLKKAAALAKVFRAYGIRLYLTARFSAPIEMGGLPTADPLDPTVQKWWNDKVAEIYKLIPDFGGFLVKANSEGQPGPQQYGRNHAEGANMLADALAPYGGIVMWRAFVYSNEEPEDRAKQAYNEFVPLDGKFRENVLIQVKNGPIDFQPREPVHPLFGAMPQTPLMMEFQITKEYLGQGTHLVGLASMYEEILQTDTYAKGKGSTVASVIDGSLHGNAITGMAGVANIGTARNWTGNLFGQADWFAFGSFAWNPNTNAAAIFEEWSALTFNTTSPETKGAITALLAGSYETCVRYMTPLGLHHIMAADHHYGPGPWVGDMPRADWTSVYYHKADAFGLGFNRTSSGSDALSQYAKAFQAQYAEIDRCPSSHLLWFHHVAWDKELSSGRTLWEELCHTYHQGATEVTAMKEDWMKLDEAIDEERFLQVAMHLEIQEKEAYWWRDACLLYFQTFSKKEIPATLDQPQHDLQYYQSLTYPYAPGIRPRW